jgi:hypothetical protein
MKSLQTMKCILCCNNPILVYNLKIQARKGLTLYNTTNGIITLKKHVNANHFIIAKKFEEEMNSRLKGEVELAKKIQIHLEVQLSSFLLPNIFSINRKNS